MTMLKDDEKEVTKKENERSERNNEEKEYTKKREK